MAVAVEGHRRRGRDVALGKLAQILRNSRWRPQFLGLLASLPVAVIMLQVWKYCEPLAIGWLFFFAFFGGLGVFWRTPTGRVVVLAMIWGTVIPLPFL
jgi:hypothetical protein